MMTTLDRARGAVTAGAFLVSLAGCAGSQPLSPAAVSASPACPAAGGGARCTAYIENESSVSGWTAADLEAAYKLPSAHDGNGQTVYVVDAYDNPNVASDFAAYRSAMGLPAGTFTKYNQTGQQSGYPQGSAGWGVEIDLDAEMVSASCPNCAVALVEANSSSWSDLQAAVAEAVKLGATIVSNSYSGTSGADGSYYDTPGVTYVASSGDAGSGSGLGFPAAFDDVVAVGGTVLAKAHNKRGYTETVWSGSNGGCATGEKKPWWQRHSPYAKNCRGRMGNDVSVIADDVAAYDSYSEPGWISLSGTSVGAGFISGIFGLAGNSTKQRGGRTFWVPASHHAHLFELGERYSAGGGWGSPDGVGAF